MTESTPTPADQGLVIIEPTPVAEGDKATLQLEEEDGRFTLKAVGGSGVPVRLPVVDEQGNVIAVYSPVVPMAEGRAAIVGLPNEHWGRVTLGRQADILDEASEFTSVENFGGMVQTVHNYDRLGER
ncbi:hypothetical protein [Streptomyces sp. ISL-86]|uniref:hypothetical protein n=1 Tax=Streptomyces sp. ISL-86 TaxID=2819187 RepID=UPI001BEBAC31|nr:hypothetical protein [Streptomyces sp. ISL-86]MBT2459578.1 hypothetical protein [Streptomyces sp. ISL-86]